MTFDDFKKYINEYSKCNPLNVSKEIIYNLASQLSEKIEKKYPTYSIYDIVRNIFKGRIHTVGLFDYTSISGSIIIHGEDNFDVLLQEYTSPLQDKFNLAHELGHYILHSDLGKEEKKWSLRDGSGSLEWEANWFASGFLIPTHKIKELSKKEELTIDLLKRRFVVSEEDAMIRLKTFKQNNF